VWVRVAWADGRARWTVASETQEAVDWASMRSSSGWLSALRRPNSGGQHGVAICNRSWTARVRTGNWRASASAGYRLPRDTHGMRATQTISAVSARLTVDQWFAPGWGGRIGPALRALADGVGEGVGDEAFNVGPGSQ